MVLQTINENRSWIQMTWKCAFIMQWPNILFAVKAMLHTFKDPEILIGDQGTGGERVNLADRPEERSMLVLRGYSNHFKSKVSIVFHTKTNEVTININQSTGLPNDYQTLAMQVGPFMDSIELRMYAAK